MALLVLLHLRFFYVAKGIYAPTLNFHGLPQVYVYAWVEESIYNKLYGGYYKSAAYQVVSITLPEGCSSSFVL